MHASLRLMHTCFLKIDPVRIVGMCVSAPEAINMDLIRLVKHVLYSCYMATVAIITNGWALALIHVIDNPIRVS